MKGGLHEIVPCLRPTATLSTLVLAGLGAGAAAAHFSVADVPKAIAAAAHCAVANLPAMAQTAEAIKAYEEAEPPLWNDLGSLTYPITTKSKEAQRYFDQGLRLAANFNHAEARRAFRKAQRLDPTCAMCFLGEAIVLGPNINVPMDPEANAPAIAALREGTGPCRWREREGKGADRGRGHAIFGGSDGRTA